MGWETGSIPGYVMIALISVSVICEMSGEVIASNQKEVRMNKTHTSKSTFSIRRLISAVLFVGAGVGGNLIASWVLAPA